MKIEIRYDEHAGAFEALHNARAAILVNGTLVPPLTWTKIDI